MGSLGCAPPEADRVLIAAVLDDHCAYACSEDRSAVFLL